MDDGHEEWPYWLEMDGRTYPRYSTKKTSGRTVSSNEDSHRAAVDQPQEARLPPSLGFRKKGGVYTAEIGRSYRALARERKGHYYWFWVGTHKDYNNF